MGKCWSQRPHQRTSKYGKKFVAGRGRRKIRADFYLDDQYIPHMKLKHKKTSAELNPYVDLEDEIGVHGSVEHKDTKVDLKHDLISKKTELEIEHKNKKMKFP